MLNTPILFLVFNRPDTTKQVFEQIKKARPKQLFVAADGPRLTKAGEADICAATRQIIEEGVDWDCELKTLFRDENLGCGKAVSQAIDWFFENVEEGIILEDDCLPDHSFFRFCEELLEKYRFDEKIMSVSGSNLLGAWKAEEQSYFFGHGGIWGWATWRRAWKMYDRNMKDWPDAAIKERIKKAIKTTQWYDYYYPMFESAHNSSLDTWDAQWFYTILLHEGTSISPSVNLVKNIGFNIGGTHTTGSNDLITNLSVTAMEFPLTHPHNVNADVEYLSLMYDALHKKQPEDNVFQKLFSKFKHIVKIFSAVL
ncbi:MAG: hypothetical protein H7Z13_10575 [Ferruginibacter sp.]|nr:hypothetical protein [Ferruginibacter sp.]